MGATWVYLSQGKLAQRGCYHPRYLPSRIRIRRSKPLQFGKLTALSSTLRLRPEGSEVEGRFRHNPLFHRPLGSSLNVRKIDLDFTKYFFHLLIALLIKSSSFFRGETVPSIFDLFEYFFRLGYGQKLFPTFFTQALVHLHSVCG